jgi:hypothetical protein
MDGVAITTHTMIQHDMLDPSDPSLKRKGDKFRKNKNLKTIEDEERGNEFELDLHIPEKEGTFA